MKFVPYLINLLFMLATPIVAFTALTITAYQPASLAAVSGAATFAITFFLIALGSLLFLLRHKSWPTDKRLLVAFAPLLAIPITWLVATGARAYQQRIDPYMTITPLEEESHILIVDGEAGSFSGIKFWVGLDEPHEVAAGYRPPLRPQIRSEPNIYYFGPLQYELPVANIRLSPICIPTKNGFEDCFAVGIVDPAYTDAENPFVCIHSNPVPGTLWAPESACGRVDEQGFIYIWNPGMDEWTAITGISTQPSMIESAFTEPVLEFEVPFPISWERPNE